MIFSHNTNQSETFPSFRLSHPVDGYLQLRRSTRRKISGRRHSGRGANWHPNYQGAKEDGDADHTLHRLHHRLGFPDKSGRVIRT